MKTLFELDSSPTVETALTAAAEHLDNAGLFFGHGTDNAWDESVWLLFWVLGVDEDPGVGILSTKISPDHRVKFTQAINRRAIEKLPAAYITGEAMFCGLPFYVDSRVLVPRSPIGELIQNDYLPWLTDAPRSILDLCCGSGCIGLAAAIYSPEARVVLADLSTEALEVAERNLARHALQDRVRICAGDLFSGLTDERFDLILCNPPYVDAEDLSSMPKEYHHEPPMGLGSGDDGLNITRKILAEAKQHMLPGGHLILEVGNSWQHLEQAYPLFPFTWLEMESGGVGVTILSYDELASFA